MIEDEARIFVMLARDEGVRYKPYDDKTRKDIKAPIGSVTLGIGRNLDAKPLSNALVLAILREDVADAIADAKSVIGESLFESLSANRKLALINLAFNLGRSRLAGFTRMIRAIKSGQWTVAGQELRDSQWWYDVDPKQQPGEGRDDRVYNLLVRDRYDY